MKKFVLGNLCFFCVSNYIASMLMLYKLYYLGSPCITFHYNAFSSDFVFISAYRDIASY